MKFILKNHYWLFFFGSFIVQNILLFLSYLSKQFAHNDLGVINEFLSNTIIFGQFFYLDHLDINHLSVLFTPSLLLFTPLYLIFNDQYLLIFLNIFSLYFLIGINLKIIEKYPIEKSEHFNLKIWFFYLFLVPTIWGKFSINLISSGHFEIVYLFFYGLLLYQIFLSSCNIIISLMIIIFICGVWEDAGLALFFNLAGYYFISKKINVFEKLKIKLIFYSIFSLLLFFVSYKYGVFIVSGTETTKDSYWGHLGENVFVIIKNIIGNPGIIYKEFVNSAFFEINKTFYYFTFLNPLYGFIMNLYGFFTRGHSSKLSFNLYFLLI